MHPSVVSHVTAIQKWNRKSIRGHILYGPVGNLYAFQVHATYPNACWEKSDMLLIVRFRGIASCVCTSARKASEPQVTAWDYSGDLTRAHNNNLAVCSCSSYAQQNRYAAMLHQNARKLHSAACWCFGVDMSGKKKRKQTGSLDGWLEIYRITHLV